MCAALSGDVKPENVTLSPSVWAVVSSTTCTEPVPSEGVGSGRSFAPERLAKRFIMSAWAAGGAGRISTDANARRLGRIEMSGGFASLAEELGTRCGFRLRRQA